MCQTEHLHPENCRELVAEYSNQSYLIINKWEEVFKKMITFRLEVIFFIILAKICQVNF